MNTEAVNDWRKCLRRVAGVTMAAVSVLVAGANAADWRAEVPAIFREADRVGVLEGDPPAAPVYAGDELLGYAVLTDRVVDVRGYSARPFSVLVGVGRTGRITGVRIIEHHEPILGAGVSEEALAGFVAQYRGVHLGNRTQIGGSSRDGYVTLDGLSGATITSIALDAAIATAARRVAVSRGLLPAPSDESAAE